MFLDGKEAVEKAVSPQILNFILICSKLPLEVEFSHGVAEVFERKGDRNWDRKSSRSAKIAGRGTKMLHGRESSSNQWEVSH